MWIFLACTIAFSVSAVTPNTTRTLLELSCSDTCRYSCWGVRHIFRYLGDRAIFQRIIKSSVIVVDTQISSKLTATYRGQQVAHC